MSLRNRELNSTSRPSITQGANRSRLQLQRRSPQSDFDSQGTLREFSEGDTEQNNGPIYAALARVYRSISEHPIALDYAQRALEQFRQAGEWRGLAEAYFGIGLAQVQEGDYEGALENLQQALKLTGDHPASYTLGKIYANMAGVCWFLKRPQEGIRYLEKAIGYYERTDHKANAANGYNNLGINLI